MKNVLRKLSNIPHGSASLDNSLKELERVIAGLDFMENVKAESSQFLLSFVDSLPLPAWIKAVDGTMLYINPAYQSVYGIETQNYVGLKDVDVWGEETANKFRKNDEDVIHGREVKYAIELIPNKNNPSNRPIQVVLAKFPLFDGPDIMAVGGIIVSLLPSRLN
jgi:PAS domain-containing protein